MHEERFGFDVDKDDLDRERHGVSLAWAQGLWDTDHLIIPAKRVSGEARALILARVDGKCFAAVFTRRHGRIRLISCHRADRRLERVYEIIRRRAQAQ
ncbi:MAG: BrnT family toxin [Elusimicrobia bacterium]|nr:BrnT family toxin [Elusimicrobiota bacterium]